MLSDNSIPRKKSILKAICNKCVFYISNYVETAKLNSEEIHRNSVLVLKKHKSTPHIKIKTQSFKEEIEQFKYTKTSAMSNMTMTLFGDEASPPVRFVQMTASMLNAPVKFHSINLFNGENFTDFYRKINPLLKVPALKVDNEIITDSHAIAIYLCDNYGGQQLYPQDSLIRARVHKMMFFNCSTLFPIDSAVFCEYFANKPLVDEKQLNDWHAALDYLEIRLGTHKWLAHDTVTLGDLCCGATVSSLELLVPPTERHANIKRWLDDLKTLHCFALNSRGLKRLRSYVENVR